MLSGRTRKSGIFALEIRWKLESEVYNSSLPLPTLLRAGYTVKLIKSFQIFENTNKIFDLVKKIKKYFIAALCCEGKRKAVPQSSKFLINLQNFQLGVSLVLFNTQV